MHRWTVHALELGRTRVSLLLEQGLRVDLDVYDGGGFVPSHGIWRVARRLVKVQPAASA